MAENNTYVIRFELPNGGQSKSPVSKSSSDSTTSEENGDKSWWAKNLDSGEKALKKIVSFSTARGLADKLISYDISTVSLRTGATEYEQKLQFGYSMLNQTLMPVVIGAATGGALGAAIGVGYSAVMTAIGWAQNAQTIEYNRQLENFSITMASERAGWSGSRSNRQ